MNSPATAVIRPMKRDDFPALEELYYDFHEHHCPGRIFPSVKQLGHMMVSQLRATGSRDASRPRLAER